MMISDYTKIKNISEYITRRNQSINRYFDASFGENATEESYSSGNQYKSEILDRCQLMYKYYSSTNSIDRLIKCLKNKDVPTIKLTQGSKISDINDPLDCDIIEVYKILPELRKKMINDLSNVLCPFLSKEESRICQNKLNNSLTISDWNSWLKRLCEINYEYQKGVTETPDEMVSIEIEKFHKNHLNYINREMGKIGIFCLCERCDSNYMWGEFCNSNHKGYCMVYDIDDFNKQGLFPVHYVDNDKHLTELTVRHFSSNFNPTLKLNCMEYKALVVKTICSKKTSYSQEIEWRLIIRFSDFQPNGEPIKSNQYIKVHPKAILLGKNFDLKTESEIRKLAGDVDIQVKKMKKSKFEDRLVVGD